MSRPLLLLPGIGADARLFAAQRAVRDVRVIEWIAPRDARESLADYAARLAREAQVGGEFDLGGASFGGMVAIEMARHLNPQSVYLFGSCRSADAIAPYLRVLRAFVMKPPRVVAPLMARWFGATSRQHVEVFVDMLANTDARFLRWAASAVFGWRGVADLAMPVRHVHGSRDRIIPVSCLNADHIIERAGHLLTLTHADEVNVWLC